MTMSDRALCSGGNMCARRSREMFELAATRRQTDAQCRDTGDCRGWRGSCRVRRDDPGEREQRGRSSRRRQLVQRHLGGWALRCLRVASDRPCGRATITQCGTSSMHNRATKKTTLVSRNSAGDRETRQFTLPRSPPMGASSFFSDASNLVADDTMPRRRLRSRPRDEEDHPCKPGAGGRSGNSGSYYPSISARGARCVRV